MGIQTTQGYNVRLYANGEELDLFEDEDIKVSDNITGLFDIGLLPSDFSRTIILPGSKKNNAFFEHVYDISVTNPFLFATNVKVNAYLDLEGFYLADGYLQLNKVNVKENKFIESYEVSLFGTISSFARETNRNTLNDLSSLSIYNHTASFDNISESWKRNLFDGDIVYPLADYGEDIFYSYNDADLGINDADGALSVQDFKPAIRVKKVIDAIFNEYGFTYESEFLSSSFFDNIYMICNYGNKSPLFEDVDLQRWGKLRLSPLISDTGVELTDDTYRYLPLNNVEYDYSGFWSGDQSSYNFPKPTSLETELNLVMRVSGSNGVPQFNFQLADTGSLANNGNKDIVSFNNFFREVLETQPTTGNKVYRLKTKFKTPKGNGVNALRLKYTSLSGSNFTVTLNPDGDRDSYFEVQKLTTAADFRIMNIPLNMPFGTEGIKQIDFIKGLQLKYNLVIYPSKTKPKHFIIETFNNWYKQGEVKSFNNFIKTDKTISVTPANNLAVRELEFGDKQSNDLLSDTFRKVNNRDYGKIYYQDNQNFFSQGKNTIETTFESIPLRVIPLTGTSGSETVTGFRVFVQVTSSVNAVEVCTQPTQIKYLPTSKGFVEPGDVIYDDVGLTTPTKNQRFISNDQSDDVYAINPNTGQVGSFIGDCPSL